MKGVFTPMAGWARRTNKGFYREHSSFGSSLSLSFINDNYSLGAIGSKKGTKSFSDIITFTRASGGGRFNASGNYEYLGNDVPRLDYDPVTLQPRGLLIEEQRTNLLLNSDTLATQTGTVTATAHTLTFYGTGSVALSGAFSGTLVGTGAANRVSLTFTPTAGSLTLTVTGSCTSGQLEAGAFPTSYIPTVASQVTRSADVASVNTLSPWYNASEGTLFVENSRLAPLPSNTPLALFNGAGTNIIRVRADASTYVFDAFNNGSNIASIIAPAGQNNKVAVAYRDNYFNISSGGVVATPDTSGIVPQVTSLLIGHHPYTGARFNGHIRNISYYPRRLSNTELQEITA